MTPAARRTCRPMAHRVARPAMPGSGGRLAALRLRIAAPRLRVALLRAPGTAPGLRRHLTLRRALAAAGIAALAITALIGASSHTTAAGLASSAAASGAPASAVPAGTAPADAASGALLGVAGLPSSIAGGGVDFFDLGVKGLIVLALLFVTLRVLGRLQGNRPGRSGTIQVLESRSLAAKASLHLVAIGGRRLVVGLTPNGMVSLAELDARELPAAERTGRETAADPDARTVGSLELLLTPLDRAAGRVGALLAAGRRP